MDVVLVVEGLEGGLLKVGMAFDLVGCGDLGTISDMRDKCLEGRDGSLQRSPPSRDAPALLC